MQKAVLKVGAAAASQRGAARAVRAARRLSAGQPCDAADGHGAAAAAAAAPADCARWALSLPLLRAEITRLAGRGSPGALRCLSTLREHLLRARLAEAAAGLARLMLRRRHGRRWASRPQLARRLETLSAGRACALLEVWSTGCAGDGCNPSLSQARADSLQHKRQHPHDGGRGAAPWSATLPPLQQ